MSAAPGRIRDNAAMHGSKPLRDWIVPGLFGALVVQTTLDHSINPADTYPWVIRNVLVAVALGFVAVLARGSRLSWPRGVVPVLVAFAVSAGISVAGAIDPGVAMVRMLFYLSIALLAMVVYLLHRDEAGLPLAKFCLVIALIHVPFLLIVLIDVATWNGVMYPFGTADVGTFGHVRHFGTAGFLAAMSATGLALLSRRLAAAAFLLTCGALLGIVAMGSRGAFLSWILFCGLLILLVPRRRTIALHVLAALALVFGLVWALQESGLFPTPNLFGRQSLGEGVSLNTFGSGRIELWRNTIGQIIRHPLFGLGPDGLAGSRCCEEAIHHPHNFFLQLLVEFGVVGTALLALLVVRAVGLIGGWRQFAALALATPENRVLAAALLATLAYAQIDGPLFHGLPLIHVGLFCGLLAAGLHRAQPPPVVNR